MSCPTCDHTVQRIGRMDGCDVPLFWCPRCGTIKANVVTQADQAPRIVTRARDALNLLGDCREAVELQACCLPPSLHYVGVEVPEEGDW